jgi:hypothetical protein
MNSKLKWTTILAAVVMAAPAHAQWHSTALGVGEVGTDGAFYLLGGFSAGPGGRGVSPMLGVQASSLGYDNGPGRTNVYSVLPYVGLSNNYGSGDLYGTVGYSFSNRDDNSPFRTATVNNVGRGVVVAGGWDHWGNGTPWGHQLLASYNLGDENFWGRGRLTRQIWADGRAQRRLGGEVAVDAGSGYHAWQPGAVLEMHSAGGSILTLGAGVKLIQGSNETPLVFKLEGVLPVIR